MAIEKVVTGIHRISLGFVNAFLIEAATLTLIDTGTAGQTQAVIAAVQSLGRQPSDVRQILITHLHTDHTGSLAELKKATGARVGMHPEEAKLVQQGISGRPSVPPPGFLGALMKPILGNRVGKSTIEPVQADFLIQDGQVIEEAGGLQALHLPGHTAGHLAFYNPSQGGVLICGDALTHWMGIGGAPIYEDYRLALKSLEKIQSLQYETICFSHGKPIVGQASTQVSKKIQEMTRQL